MCAKTVDLAWPFGLLISVGTPGLGHLAAEMAGDAYAFRASACLLQPGKESAPWMYTPF